MSVIRRLRACGACAWCLPGVRPPVDRHIPHRSGRPRTGARYRSAIHAGPRRTEMIGWDETAMRVTGRLPEPAVHNDHGVIREVRVNRLCRRGRRDAGRAPIAHRRPRSLPRVAAVAPRAGRCAWRIGCIIANADRRKAVIARGPEDGITSHCLPISGSGSKSPFDSRSGSP
jgi:hypothetical protein